MTKHLWTRPRFILVFSLFLFCLFGLLFAETIDEIWVDKKLLVLDHATNHWVTTHQKPYERLFFRIITDLSGSAVLAVFTLFIAGGLWYYRHKTESIIFLSGFITTAAGVTVFKHLMHRARPFGASLVETSASFPSSHAAHSLFFFGFLAYLLSRRIHKKSVSFLVFSTGLGIAGLIGISRIYLNMHWVSDVLGGFALSAAILSLCIGFLEMRKHP